MKRIFAVIGAFSGFLAVAMGAFGAHGLKSARADSSLGIDYLLEVWQTATHYQIVHALAMFIIVYSLTQRVSRGWIIVAGWAFVAGSVIFSGSLYLLVLTEVKTWGAVTPIGGVAFLLGWVLLGVGWWIGSVGDPE